jgi:hypothetical protein
MTIVARAARTWADEIRSRRQAIDALDAVPVRADFAEIDLQYPHQILAESR